MESKRTLKRKRKLQKIMVVYCLYTFLSFITSCLAEWERDAEVESDEEAVASVPKPKPTTSAKVNKGPEKEHVNIVFIGHVGTFVFSLFCPLLDVNYFRRW